MNEKVAMDYSDREKILVVDDEPRIRDACKLVLAEQGFEVALAEDGDQGVEMIKKEHFDIILVDLMMPGLSGLEVLAYVRNKHPHTVVIVITGYATLEHSIAAMKKGAFDFIPKPFTPEQLRTVVDKALTYNRALQDIADSNSRLKTLVNSLSDGVMAVDRDQRVVLANPAFLHMIDYHGASVIGQTIDALPVGETLGNMVAETMASVGSDFTEIVEELSWERGGEKQIFRATSTPFRGRTGGVIGTIVVLNDITALKELDQLKSDFVSLVCHEVRSPMNSLLMQIQVILDGLAGDLTDKQIQILNRVSGKMLGLTEMVSELLDLSRIESGLITSEKEQLDFNALLADQLELHTPGAAEKSIALDLETVQPLPTIVASRRGLEEVMTNLITNAIKYSPEKSAIRVSARIENAYLQVAVEDSGFGIPPEDLDRVFNRFYRVKDENTREQQGTGLGLSLVKSIIENHHGSVKVASTLGEGTAFSFLIPIAGEH